METRNISWIYIYIVESWPFVVDCVTENRENVVVLQVELLPSKRSGEVKVNMRSFTPRIIESEAEGRRNDPADTKPSIQSYHLKRTRIGNGYSMNDLDKLTVDRKSRPNLSIESLKSILRNSDVSYMDNGDICRHDIGGSVPDFKKIFVTEFI